MITYLMMIRRSGRGREGTGTKLPHTPRGRREGGHYLLGVGRVLGRRVSPHGGHGNAADGGGGGGHEGGVGGGADGRALKHSNNFY